MKSIVLVFPSSDFFLSELAEALDGIGVVSQVDMSLTVERDSGVAFLVKITDVVSDGVFEDWPDSLVPIGTFSAFAVKYRGDILMLDILSLLARKADLIVDNDHGAIADGLKVSGHFLNPEKD